MKISKCLLFLSAITIVFSDPSSDCLLPIPGLNYDAWWGPEELRELQDTSIRPFQVNFTNETSPYNLPHPFATITDELAVIALNHITERILSQYTTSPQMTLDLLYRLKHRRQLIPSLEGVWFEYGINSDVVEEWLTYWENDYNFKYREKVLNSVPHYKTNVQGLDIHFVWAKPQVLDHIQVVPLLLLNGWPSSFVEFLEVIPRLVAPDAHREFAVEVISPSLPGFTLSEGTTRPGLSAVDMAVIFRNLMHRLGHHEYYVQGGDFGSMVANGLATLFPQEVLGYHTNLPYLLSLPARLPSLASLLIPDMGNSIYAGNNTKGRTSEDNIQQLAYLYYQSTKSDTLGMALNESPTGLLAYLLEKFHFGSVLDRRENAGARLDSIMPRDKVLDTITLYWMTRSITTSMRIYAEVFNRRTFAMNIDEIRTPVPTWVLEAKYEISGFSTGTLQNKYPNLIQHRTLEYGGHFLPIELPEMFSNDVLDAITAFRSWHIRNKRRNEL
ncbi:juvenile hormone epoxide hydrolase-like [Achroia grisella]|uniref:juvenile hormone epoxide hydrolase-like n=1 Tax=Achroia grisella TaxID=688607 RepID=UPI0027D28643|nr:juvenile hormone epoxide hydrolase-like [Achroia grisella]